jgi:3-methyladenine DNA glycosylase AlkD
MKLPVQKALQALANPEKKAVFQRFFKTGPGQYGEGDVFLGLSVPQTRQVAKEHVDLSFQDLEHLLASPIHEERLLALEVLCMQYKKAPKQVVDFYLSHLQGVNNWDLVDLSAPKILGDFLLNEPRNILYDLVKSPVLWERRISIIATLAFIRKGDFADTLSLATQLLGDKHDLMHKAVGWMLREVGKKDRATLEGFLKNHNTVMPRTALRYAIEHFTKAEREVWMRKYSCNPTEKQ